MLEQVKKAVLNYVDVKEEDITPETEFVRDLKMNSYDLITMVGEFEENFGIEIPEEEVSNLMSVGDVAAYLTAHVK